MFYNIVVHADGLRQWYPIFSREFYVMGACVHIRANLKKYGPGLLGSASFPFEFLGHEQARLSKSFDWVIGHVAFSQLHRSKKST